MTNHPIKVVVSGPVGAGKTTFIQTLSETDVVSTEAQATEDIGKETTTVALDYGSLVVDDFPIHLFGTPGQERFSFMWEVLCEGAIGLILLVAGDRPKDFPQARRILDFITTQVPITTVIGVTRQDCPRVWAPEDVADFFQYDPHLVVGLDGRQHEQGLRTLYHLFLIINERATSSVGSEPC